MNVKRSLSLAGHRTSLALEPEFWAAAESLAERRGLSLAGLVLDIDRARGERNLASAVRVAVLADLSVSPGVPGRTPSS
ncbi:ribbon-helix-helix domain-containing protein [Pleomorphomonas sp. JP5]|uniref:ribbon-helix-helix domain-containing protein n=1 Tax=Pleomorphomonas sp. JP5 TaxID=2942998 RepID=UPI0020443A3E|nr:ribbon-helix-helix domain-containing protein [Pleomorphomonas sp. JP5]MCM5556902.1 ribbon-helix-helix domain-containing protein [Pleomorphomonas sp. JP5]